MAAVGPRQNPPEGSSDLRLLGFHIVKGEKSDAMWGKCGESLIWFILHIIYIYIKSNLVHI